MGWVYRCSNVPGLNHSTQVAFHEPVQEFVLCILMVSWTSYINLQPEHPFEVLEFFAGHAAIARTAEDHGYQACAVDILYDDKRSMRAIQGKRSPFDLNSDAGFACSDFYQQLFFLYRAGLGVLL